MHTHTHSGRLSRLTSGAHVDEGVVDQNQFIEVELIGEPLAFGLMEDPLIVVIPGETHTDLVQTNTLGPLIQHNTCTLRLVK